MPNASAKIVSSVFIEALTRRLLFNYWGWRQGLFRFSPEAAKLFVLRGFLIHPLDGLVVRLACGFGVADRFPRLPASSATVPPSRATAPRPRPSFPVPAALCKSSPSATTVHRPLPRRASAGSLSLRGAGLRPRTTFLAPPTPERHY